MRIAIASDQGGFCQKADLKSYLESLGCEVTDFGPVELGRVDYPDFADPVARAVAKGDFDRGVLICGTGLGMALTADKVAGIRAVPVQNTRFAELARAHNNANIVCLSGRFVTLSDNMDILKVFVEREFDGGRHAIRVAKIMKEDDPTFAGVRN